MDMNKLGLLISEATRNDELGVPRWRPILVFLYTVNKRANTRSANGFRPGFRPDKIRPLRPDKTRTSLLNGLKNV